MERCGMRAMLEAWMEIEPIIVVAAYKIDYFMRFSFGATAKCWRLDGRKCIYKFIYRHKITPLFTHWRCSKSIRIVWPPPTQTTADTIGLINLQTKCKIARQKTFNGNKITHKTNTTKSMLASNFWPCNFVLFRFVAHNVLQFSIVSRIFLHKQVLTIRTITHCLWQVNAVRECLPYSRLSNETQKLLCIECNCFGVDPDQESRCF